MSRRVRWILLLALLLGAGAVYFTFSPTESQWFPKCILKTVTGYDCPGCGAQRALHAALHGRLGEALGYNLFLVVGLPYLLAATVASLSHGRVGQWIDRHLLSPTMIWVYVVLYMVWWPLRNVLGL